jgi:hypothetical protein
MCISMYLQKNFNTKKVTSWIRIRNVDENFLGYVMYCTLYSIYCKLQYIILQQQLRALTSG